MVRIALLCSLALAACQRAPLDSDDTSTSNDTTSTSTKTTTASNNDSKCTLGSPFDYCDTTRCQCYDPLCIDGEWDYGCSLLDGNGCLTDDLWEPDYDASAQATLTSNADGTYEVAIHIAQSNTTKTLDVSLHVEAATSSTDQPVYLTLAPTTLATCTTCLVIRDGHGGTFVSDGGSLVIDEVDTTTPGWVRLTASQVHFTHWDEHADTPVTDGACHDISGADQALVAQYASP